MTGKPPIYRLNSQRKYRKLTSIAIIHNIVDFSCLSLKRVLPPKNWFCYRRYVDTYLYFNRPQHCRFLLSIHGDSAATYVLIKWSWMKLEYLLVVPSSTILYISPVCPWWQRCHTARQTSSTCTVFIFRSFVHNIYIIKKKNLMIV